MPSRPEDESEPQGSKAKAGGLSDLSVGEAVDSLRPDFQRGRAFGKPPPDQAAEDEEEPPVESSVKPQLKVTLLGGGMSPEEIQALKEQALASRGVSRPKDADKPSAPADSPAKPVAERAKPAARPASKPAAIEQASPPPANRRPLMIVLLVVAMLAAGVVGYLLKQVL